MGNDGPQFVIYPERGVEWRWRLIAERRGQARPIGQGHTAGGRGFVDGQVIDGAESGAARGQDRPARQAEAEDLPVGRFGVPRHGHQHEGRAGEQGFGGGG